MPGRKWYAIALLVFVASIALAALVVYSRLNGLAQELPQIVVPGEAHLTLSRVGTYTIYLEREAVVNGRLYSTTDDIEGLRVRVSSPSGAPIEMARPAVDSNYAIGGRSGTAVLAYTIAEPGQYRLAAEYPDGRTGPQGVLAVGLGVPEKIVATIFQAMGIGVIGFVMGVVVAGMTFWRRRRASRREAVETSPGPVTLS